jgi:phospholipid/cholesterol/gamma-HCH transport system ATP-binding protein
MIEVKNVYKSFGKDLVLTDISVSFDQGITNLIIGRSGSGKTVLLKAIVGLHGIDTGEIYFDGREFISMTESQKQGLRKEMGMLFQGSALFDSLTVQENIIFPLEMYTDMTFEEKLERVNSCLKMVELENVNDLYPAELSGGMKKRVGIARAIVQSPKYLFCDEPNSGLDPMTALVIDSLISKITHELNITTIINTHDMNSVMEIGEKVVFIHEGFKCWEGTNNEVLNSDDKYLNDFVFASNLAKKIKNFEIKT